MVIVLNVLLNWQDIQFWATLMALLFGIVTLHELGHCLVGEMVGGTADEAILWPLGGLAMTSPPHRPWHAFLTVAAGPATNLLICLLWRWDLAAYTAGTSFVGNARSIASAAVLDSWPAICAALASVVQTIMPTKGSATELPFVFVYHVAGFVRLNLLYVYSITFEDVNHFPDAGDVLGGSSFEPTDTEAKRITSEGC